MAATAGFCGSKGGDVYKVLTQELEPGPQYVAMDACLHRWSLD